MHESKRRWNRKYDYIFLLSKEKKEKKERKMNVIQLNNPMKNEEIMARKKGNL